MVESMVEVYYNSGQFQNTIACIEPLFEDAFTLYEKLGQYYEKKGYSEISHSRMRRYEILLEFVREETGGSKDAITWEKVAGSMIYDLYLRKSSKAIRPLKRTRSLTRKPSGNTGAGRRFRRLPRLRYSVTAEYYYLIMKTGIRC